MKILSRKVIASMLVFITATIFVWFGIIGSADWTKLAIVTVISYIAGSSINVLVKYKRVQNDPCKLYDPQKKTTIKEQLIALLDASFISAIVLYVVATALMWFGKIGITEWTYVAMGTVLGYDLLNPLSKFKFE